MVINTKERYEAPTTAKRARKGALTIPKSIPAIREEACVGIKDRPAKSIAEQKYKGNFRLGLLSKRGNQTSAVANKTRVPRAGARTENNIKGANGPKLLDASQAILILSIMGIHRLFRNLILSPRHLR
jgi:hypothetical protein